VLSGFVLAYSLLKQPVGYAGYAAKRVFRIYPAFLFSVLLAYFLHACIGVPNHFGDSDFLNRIDDIPVPTPAMLLQHLGMVGTLEGRDLDGVIWSLVHEMRISLIFPFMLWEVRKYEWRGVLGFWAVSALCGFYVLYTGGNPKGYDAATFGMSLVETGAFLVFFAGGAYLAVEREAVARKISRLSWPWQLFLCIAVIGCFCKGDYAGGELASGDKISLFAAEPILVDYVRGVGAVGLIAVALGVQKIQKALGHKILTWLGHVSYSLYLIHIPILYVLSQTIGATWTLVPLSLAVIILSLGAAELMARYIEKPGIRLGKHLARHSFFHPRRSAAA